MGWQPSPAGPQRLRAAILECGYSMLGFARATGMHHQTLRRIESGVAGVTVPTAHRILDALDADWHHVWQVEARPRRGLTGWIPGAGAWQTRVGAELAGQPLRDVARRSGVAEQSLREWQAGERAPTVSRLLLLCRSLEIHPADLFQPRTLDSAPED